MLDALNLDALNKIGPFLSGIGVLIAATAAWASFVLFSRRTLHAGWLDTFRKLYDEFWKESESRQVRRYIDNDIEYNEIEGVLKQRMNTDRNTLSKDANDAIEKIDVFCALLMKIQAFERTTMNPNQRRLLEQSYGKLWPRKIRKREALCDYIKKYWPDVEL